MAPNPKLVYSTVNTLLQSGARIRYTVDPGCQQYYLPTEMTYREQFEKWGMLPLLNTSFQRIQPPAGPAGGPGYQVGRNALFSTFF